MTKRRVRPGKPGKKKQAFGQIRVQPSAPTSTSPTENRRSKRATAFRPTGFFYDGGASAIEESTNPDEERTKGKVTKKSKRRT